LHTPHELSKYWRAHAAEIESYAPHAAAAFQRAADQLELALNTSANEVLTLDQAAAESGYSADHLGRLLREQKIPNAGRANAPRILRGDLPRKPAITKRASHAASDLQNGSLVRSIFASKRGRA
jgi:hypothetical protein